MRCAPTLECEAPDDTLRMADFDDLEEFCDEAGAALEDGTPVLDFRVTRGTDLSFSIIEAFQAVIQLVASMPGDAEVPCLFGSQRALEMAERYQAGGEAADTVLQAGGIKVVVRLGDITRTLADAGDLHSRASASCGEMGRLS